MPNVRAPLSLPVHAALRDDAIPSVDNPGRAFANGVMLALPLWGLVGLGIWAIV